MLGNPNTPQGERSLEDTEKESEKEGAAAGQERSCAWKWCLREQTWVSGADGSVTFHRPAPGKVVSKFAAQPWRAPFQG